MTIQQRDAVIEAQRVWSTGRADGSTVYERGAATQAALAAAGAVAIPPPGHHCPDCCGVRDLYCLSTAVARLRREGAFADAQEGADE